MIKKIFKSFFKIILILALLITVFVILAPTFGDGNSNTSRKEVQNSVHFHDGHFHNLVDTPMMTRDDESDSIFTGIKNMLFPSDDKNPNKPLPSEKFNKDNFKNGDFVWLGHASVMFKLEDKVFLTDPVFNRASPVSIYGKPFALENETKIEDLPDIDVVLISHDHYDHLDYQAILDLSKKTDKFFLPLGNKAHFKKWGIEEDKIIEKDWYESGQYQDIKITLTPSRHFSGRSITDGNKTLWGGWVINSKEAKVYFSGDTGYFDEFKKIGDDYGPFDIAFIDSGAYDKDWAHVHMMPEESVQASLDLRSKSYLPIGWAKFDLANHSWKEPAERAFVESQVKGVNMTTPLIGKTFSLDELPKERWWESAE